MSIQPVRSSHYSLEEAKFSEVSSDTVLSSKDELILLEGAQLDRFESFFDRRTYEYRAEITPYRQKPYRVFFTFELVPYLQRCVEALDRQGIKVKGVFTKGGVVHKTVTGSEKPLADLDLTIEIEPPKDWTVVEQTLFEPLAKIARVHPDVFSHKGSKKNRFLVRDENNEFAIYTLPTFYEGKEQDIDIQVVAKSKASCFCSADSIQINLGSLDALCKEPSYRSVGEGYPLRESLDLMMKGKFKAYSDDVKNLRDGFRGFCRILTRGYMPLHMDYEPVLWKKFLGEYRPTEFKRFEASLLDYLKAHYHVDSVGKIFYLLNYYELMSRCSEGPNALSPNEKAEIERVIFSQLYAAAGQKCPQDVQKIREEIKLIQTYFYLQSREKKVYSHQNNPYVFLRSDTSDFLLFKSPVGEFEEILKGLPEDLSQYALLEGLTGKKENLQAFLEKGIAREIRSQKPKNEVVERQESPPMIEYQTFEEARNAIFDFLSEKRVTKANEILKWMLEKTNLIPEGDRSKFLQSVFKKFCSVGSMGQAEKFFRYLLHHNEPEMIEFSWIYSQYITVGSDVVTLLKMVDSLNVGFENVQDLIEFAFFEALQKYPDQIGFVLSFVTKNASVEFQSNLGVKISQINPDKRTLLFCFDELYRSIGQRLFIDETLGELLFDSIKGYIDALASMKEWDKVVDFYGGIEPYVVKSASFSEIFKRFMFSACLSSQEKKATSLIRNGLNQILKMGLVDKHSLAALAIIAKYPQKVEELDNLLISCKRLIPESPEEDEKSNAESSRLIKTIGRLEALNISKADADERLQNAEKLAYSDPTNEANWAVYYTISHEQSKTDEFIKKLEESCKADPKNIALRKMLIEYYTDYFSILQERLPQDEVEKIRHGFTKKTIQLCADLCALEKDNEVWPATYAINCVVLGKYQQAIVGFKNAIKINPDNTENHLKLADCQFKVNGSAESLKTLNARKNAIESQGANKVELAKIYSALAQIHALAKQNEDADACFLRAIELNEDDCLTGISYVFFLGALGRIDEAAKNMGLVIHTRHRLNHDRREIAENLAYQARLYLSSSTPELALTPLELAMHSMPELEKSNEYLEALKAQARSNQELYEFAEIGSQTRANLYRVIKDQEAKINKLSLNKPHGIIHNMKQRRKRK